MEVQEFLKQLGRMCPKYHTCIGCPLATLKGKYSCIISMADSPSKAVEIVQKWAEENPERTYIKDFLEKHPQAQLNSAGIPVVCARSVGYPIKEPCYGKCRECWNTPIEEENYV